MQPHCFFGHGHRAEAFSLVGRDVRPDAGAKTSSMLSHASIVSSRVPSQSKMNPIRFDRLIGCPMAWLFLDGKACSILGARGEIAVKRGSKRGKDLGRGRVGSLVGCAGFREPA